MERAARRQREALALARAVQQNLLPLPPPPRPGIRAAARYEPMEELGGDFFDVVDLGGAASGFFLADVVGHGTAAALFTSFLKGQLVHWSLRMQRDSPCETLTDINLALCKVFGGTGRFVTAVYATYEAGVDRLRFSCAGHPPPLYFPAGGEPYLLDGGELPLGVFEDTLYRTREARFAPGDRVYFYTDGVIEERRDGRGEGFGTGRLLAALARRRDSPLEAGLDELMRALGEWRGAGARLDDLNVLAIEAAGAGAVS